MSLKYNYFFFLIINIFSQSVHSQPNPPEINFADNYFAQKEYTKAKAIYYNLIRNKSKIEKNALLKLAFIHEQENDFTKTLYFLNLYFERNPSEKVLVKMNSIALENDLDGYELNDFYLILLLFKQYSFVINMILAFLAIYVSVVFIIKKTKKQPILLKHKIVLLLYLVVMFLILNISKFYKQGIIHNPNTTLRIDPSAASPVNEILPAGQRINIVGSDDIWLRIYRNNKFYYINKTNVWLVN
jgi:hypothetical protein